MLIRRQLPALVRRHVPWDRWPVAAVVIGAALLSGAACAASQPHYRVPSAAGAVPAVTSPNRPPAPPPATAVSTSTEIPLDVQIPLQGVRARVIPEGVLADGTLAVPSDPHVLGWWRYGARVGSHLGTVVLDGHVDTAAAGPGALFRLDRLPLGATVDVGTTHRITVYRVVARRVYNKSSLPTSVFARSGPPRLVLVTCGGPFDSSTGHYRDNVVVYAVPAAS